MARHLMPRAAMDAFRQDLRHALRVLARSPAFTAMAVLTLAAGIGANATIFGFLNALLLRPFPLLEAERLVAVWERHPQQGAPGGARGGDQNPRSVADYLDVAAGNAGLERIAGYRMNCLHDAEW